MTSLASGQNLVVRFGKSGITPIIELVKAIFKKRPDNQRNLIFLQVSLKLQVYLTANMFHLFSQLISIKLFQILLYIVYWFIYEQEFMMYEYLLIKFPGFDGQSFSNLIIFSNIVNMIASLIFIPILAARFHDSFILIVGLLLTCIGLVIKSFAQKIWHIYIGQVSIW